jgi:2-polyprenyl-6-methoxyphenol hydroxylase-like FAD-dependent oxidoreductase
MPQWDFLDFLAARGRRYAGFHLFMKAEATELIEEQGQIVGLRGIAEGGLIDIRANLVIGADGRHSTVRKRASLKVDDLGAPMARRSRLSLKVGLPTAEASSFAALRDCRTIAIYECTP